MRTGTRQGRAQGSPGAGASERVELCESVRAQIEVGLRESFGREGLDGSRVFDLGVSRGNKWFGRNDCILSQESGLHLRD
jgi:hypothetical protein